MKNFGSKEVSRRICWVLCGLFLSIMMMGQTVFAKQTLKDITLQQTSDGFKLEIIADSHIEDYQLSNLKDPSRMVVDFPGEWDYPGKSVFNLTNDVIESVVVGEHPERLRVVVHLKGNKTLSPYIDESSTSIILTIKRNMITEYSASSAASKPESPENDAASSEKAVTTKIVKEIRTDISEQHLTLNVVADSPVYDFKSFFLKDEAPPKFVVDISGSWENKDKSVITLDKGPVELVRIGEHSDHLRLVMELRDKDISVPIIEESAEGLILTLKK